MWELFQSQRKRKAGRLLWSHTSESSLLFRLLSLPAVAGESLRSCRSVTKIVPASFAFRARSGTARRLGECRGGRAGCFRGIAGGTPATTALLWREETAYSTKKRF